MHEYSQVLYKRIMATSGRLKSWTDNDIRRFSSFCAEKAPSCACGCNEKVMVDLSFGSITSQCSRFISRGVSPKFKERLYGHNYPSKLSKDQFQAAIASIVGDGYMSLGNSLSTIPRIAWNMGNSEHAEYKREFFKDFGTTLTEKENPGWGSKWFCVATKSCLAFSYIFKELNVKNKTERARKVFPLLDNVGWAWFYGDDGHFNVKQGIMYLHTEGLGEAGSQIAADSVNKFLGMNTAKVDKYLGGTPKKMRYMVRLKKDGTDEFFKRVKGHMARGVEYKTS